MTSSPLTSQSNEKMDHTSNIFELSLFSSHKDQLLKITASHLENSSKLAYIFTPNPEQVMEAQTNMQFKQDLQAADWLLPDGSGLLWAARWLQPSQPLAERIPGVEVVEKLLSLATAQHYRVLVLGGQAPAAYQQLFSRLREQGLQIEWLPGYQQVTQPQSAEEQAILHTLEKLRPQLVFVAFGAPHQERWCISHRNELEKAGVKLAMVVGGSFDFIAGVIPRAPVAWQKLHLEWLYRLWQEPWRWRRQLKLVQFVALTIRLALFGSKKPSHKV